MNSTTDTVAGKIVAEKEQAETQVSPGDRIVAALQGLLPEGAAVAVCWRDWALGSGGANTPGGGVALRRRAEQAIAEVDHDLDVDAEPNQVIAVWNNEHDNVRMAVAAALPLWLGSAERQAWLRLAKTLVESTLNISRAQARIQSLEKSRHLQQAMYDIADLAGANLGLGEMLRRVHATIARLLCADNCQVVLFNEARNSARFLYFSDARASRPPELCVEYDEGQMPDNLVFPLLRHGQPARGPAILVRQRLGVKRDPQAQAPECLDWLGVPMLRDNRVVGAIVLTSYDLPGVYADEDRALLGYVAQHILAALDRKQVQAELDRRIAEHTRELQATHEKLRQAHAELERRIEERTRETECLNAQLRKQTDERLRAEEQLVQFATRDALTGLPNRVHLLESLEQALGRAHYAGGASFAVFFLDLDRFKLVNDSTGHAAGDILLCEMSRRLRSVLRPEEVVARLGGDEFALLVEYVPARDDLRARAGDILAAVGKPLWIGGREIFPSGSIGIAAWQPRYRKGEDMLRDADAAMYRAKAAGRDRCEVFDEAMREVVVKTLDLEADLRRAIKNKDFVAYFQPIVHLDDHTVVGHEALLRWRHENYGLMLPGEFIAMGEESGLMEQVDWVMYEQVAERLAEGGDTYVSVNVSPRHFRSPDFATRFLDLFKCKGADVSRVRLEITEGALLEDAPRTQRILHTLRHEGVLIFLDDFGTGFSGLSYLHRFPISVVKIDRSFVAGLDDKARPESLALVRAILALASSLGIGTVAEGVETRSQRRALLDLGCTHAQGYLFGRPARQIVREICVSPDIGHVH